MLVLNWNDKLYEKSCPFKKKDIRTFGYPTFNFWLQFRTETNKSSKSKDFCRGKLIAQQLEKVFVEQTNCDVELLFEDEEVIGGHISILVARSPVFSAMFYHNLQKSMTGKVFVQAIRPQIFKEMLH
ncbi:hypothetical protein DAPPUDRAFT_322321 [Daphnia pulex]|uniref:BTB domain-containing protein n=1 Tax=Daphnia pulex TaxID=6669 RepID=E9GVK6_DAPPU|nr:hypothetical protein DAPPUDRAFT_322321 [Daphnia pulex]|eukprot:EFX76427.1 hypothetical protein DAPPUDRAFT_322321 [Daphnia pulex]